MNLSQTHINQIEQAFHAMTSKRDLLRLLNWVNYLIHGDKAKGFQLKSLTYYSNPNIAKNRYTSFAINKKSGGERTIHAPVKGLKAFQKALNVVLQCVHTPHEAATGFIWDKSIVDNARKHVGKHYVFNTDLKDFFPSIDQARFWGRLKHPPFNLNEENGTLKLANIIAGLCGAELEVERLKDGKWIQQNRFVLPQGAPTSPSVSNIIAKRLDYKLTGLAKRFGCTYTRYADDLTFSSMHNVYKKNSAFRNELKRIVEAENFHIKESKTRLIEDIYRQEVTGLVVNEKVNVNRRYVKTLRMWLYYWEKYGYEKAAEIFKKDYKKDKGHVKKGEPNFKKVLGGKLQYMKMVKGPKDGTYRKLKKRFDKLIAKDSVIKKVLDIWESKGIQVAANMYYNRSFANSNETSANPTKKSMKNKIEPKNIQEPEVGSKEPEPPIPDEQNTTDIEDLSASLEPPIPEETSGGPGIDDLPFDPDDIIEEHRKRESTKHKVDNLSSSDIDALVEEARAEAKKETSSSAGIKFVDADASKRKPEDEKTSENLPESDPKDDPNLGPPVKPDISEFDDPSSESSKTEKNEDTEKESNSDNQKE